MKRILIGVAAVMLVALMSGPVFATSQLDAVIAMHLQEHPQKGGLPCELDPATRPCADYVTSGDLNTSYDIYLVVAEGDPIPGIAAMSCGIVYNNGVLGGAASGDGADLDMYGWTFCASGLQFPNGPGSDPADEWPASGGGNRMTWDASVDCQTTELGDNGVQAIAGSFYVFAYGPDFFQITENNNLQSGPELQIGDCSNSITNILVTAAGFVKFSSGATDQGCNPCVAVECVPVATAPTTWGKIKQKYN